MLMREITSKKDIAMLLEVTSYPSILEARRRTTWRKLIKGRPVPLLPSTPKLKVQHNTQQNLVHQQAQVIDQLQQALAPKLAPNTIQPELSPLGASNRDL